MRHGQRYLGRFHLTLRENIYLKIEHWEELFASPNTFLSEMSLKNTKQERLMLPLLPISIPNPRIIKQRSHEHPAGRSPSTLVKSFLII